MELHAPTHRFLVLERTRFSAKCTKNAKKHFSVVNDMQIYDFLDAVVVEIAQVLKTSRFTNESQKWKPKISNNIWTWISSRVLAVWLIMDFNKWNPFWTTCFAVMAFLIIVGNSLTMATLMKRNFHKCPHLLLISLAVGDFLVGCTIPLYVVGMVVLSHSLSLCPCLLLWLPCSIYLWFLLKDFTQFFAHFVIDSLLGKSTRLP